VHAVGHDWGSLQLWHAVTTAGGLDGRIRGFTSISGPGIDQVPFTPGQALRSWYVGAFHLPGAPLLAKAALSPARFRRRLEREGAATDEAWPAPTLPDDVANGVGLYRANMLRRLTRRRPTEAVVPVQLIVARRDPFVAPSSVEGAARWAPDVTRVDVDAGHWVVRSRPDEVAAAVLDASGRTAGAATP
jgi:pimeloyl-ACP methyl ester carboxylesterase